MCVEPGCMATAVSACTVLCNLSNQASCFALPLPLPLHLRSAKRFHTGAVLQPLGSAAIGAFKVRRC